MAVLVAVLALAGCQPDIPVIPDESAAPNATLSATETSAPSATTQTSSRVPPYREANADYIIADSNTRYLDVWDVQQLDEQTLALARNEIYARHGFPFRSEQYVSYFSQKSWYQADEGFDESQLATVEHRNIQFLSIAENLRKFSQGLELAPTEHMSLSLDGDQPCELFSFTFADGQEGSYQSLSMTMGEQAFTLDGNNLTGKVYLYDLNTDDGYMELFVPEAGPSDDYAVHLVTFDGGSFHDAGLISGGYNDLKLMGGGVVTGRNIGQVLCTWVYDAEYRLTGEHRIAFVPKESYEMNLSVTMLDDLKLFKAPDGKHAAFTIKQGEAATLTRTDNQSWVELRRESDQEVGYFLLDETGMYLSDGRSATDVFNGVFWAG
jgi:nuclear transport factor 2 (NTF2) superfamily protein